MVDEILIKVVNQQGLIWIAINSIDKVILDIQVYLSDPCLLLGNNPKPFDRDMENTDYPS